MTNKMESLLYFDSRCDEKYNDGNEYYTFSSEMGKSVIYFSRFPLEWAIDHSPHTGPEECDNCLYHGCKDGVFLGYCLNCATYYYNNSRGCGFDYHDLNNGVFDSYLTGVNLDVIGINYVDLRDYGIENVTPATKDVNEEEPFYTDEEMDYTYQEYEYQEDESDNGQEEEEQEFVQYGFTSLIGGSGSIFMMDAEAGYNSY